MDELVCFSLPCLPMACTLSLLTMLFATRESVRRPLGWTPEAPSTNGWQPEAIVHERSNTPPHPHEISSRWQLISWQRAQVSEENGISSSYTTNLSLLVTSTKPGFATFLSYKVKGKRQLLDFTPPRR